MNIPIQPLKPVLTWVVHLPQNGIPLVLTTTAICCRYTAAVWDPLIQPLEGTGNMGERENRNQKQTCPARRVIFYISEGRDTCCGCLPFDFLCAKPHVTKLEASEELSSSNVPFAGSRLGKHGGLCRIHMDDIGLNPRPPDFHGENGGPLFRSV